MKVYPKKLDQGKAYAWYLKGISLCSLEREDEVLHCFERFVELDPGNEETSYETGFGLAALGRFYEALPCLEKAVELDPENTDAWYTKAVTEDQLGLRQAAARSYRMLLALRPNGDEKEVEYARLRVQELGSLG